MNELESPTKNWKCLSKISESIISKAAKEKKNEKAHYI